MKCSVCSANVEDDAVVCPACRAVKMLSRTPLGVVVGVIGIVATTLTAMMVIPLPLLFLFGISLDGFPWVMPILGTLLAAGSIWYSNQTRFVAWHRSER